jgi:hypothetical protein
MYLATTFKVIGWWGAVAKMECGEEREATMTMNEAINLLQSLAKLASPPFA